MIIEMEYWNGTAKWVYDPYSRLMKISYENFEANDDGRIFNEDEINELKIPRETVFFLRKFY